MLQEGVTLIEALVTLGIVSVGLAVGVPAVRDIVATNRMSSAVNDIVTSLHIARNEAVKRADQAVLCASTNWNLPSAQCADVNLAEGWVIFVDVNADDVRDAGEALIFAHQPLDQSITLTGENLVRFSDLGIPSVGPPGDMSDIEFLLCDERGNSVSGDITAGRKINMTTTGRPLVVATLAEVNC